MLEKVRKSFSLPLKLVLDAGALAKKRLNQLPNKRKFSAKGTEFLMRPTYLDAIATTRVDLRVLDAMLPFYVGQFGNAHSRTHLFGWETEKAVERARKQVAALLGAKASEVVFTSGATEANNLAIKGLADFLKQNGQIGEAVTVKTEHKAVLEAFRALETRGWTVHYLTPQRDGRVTPEMLQKVLNDKTRLVSVMAVNNETGVVQDVGALGAAISDFNFRNQLAGKETRVFFHVDAAQAFGKLALVPADCHVDLLSLSGHKIYGPKGVGVLYVNSRPVCRSLREPGTQTAASRPRLRPLFSGGGQERGLRSGTLPVPLVVGLGKAAALCAENMAADYKHVKRLSDRLVAAFAQIPGVHLNCTRDRHFPGVNNFSFEFVEGESLLMGLKQLALSSGSACTSASLEPSYVLKALGLGDELAHTSLRFGIGRFTTEAEISKAIAETRKWVAKLRALSPLWEMHQEGVDLSKIEWTA